MTYVEKYEKEDTWWGKIIIMELYHLVAKQKHPDWTLSQTASVFSVSIALVSENLKIADISHKRPEIYNLETRAEALKKVRRD